MTSNAQAAGRCSAEVARFVVLAALLALVALFSQPATARENVILAVDQASDESEFRFIFKVDGEASAELVDLSATDRIAIDFANTLSAAAFPDPPEDSLVAGIRHGLAAPDRYRVIYSLSRAADATLSREAIGEGRTRLTLTLRAGAPTAERSDNPLGAGEREGEDATASATPDGSESPMPSPTRALTIALDAGHGGVDEGAVSESGTLEKAINLAMARSLRETLLRAPDVTVIMTRDDDRFIPLEKRYAIAREGGADLFVSLHADSIRYHDLRGATVYTLSETASDALSRRIAAGENAADRFASEAWRDDGSDVSDILIDLTRRETVGFSEHFAAALIEDLKSDDIGLIKRPKRSAAFKVLEAPDVPSVLIEAGFLSNGEDEALLKDPEWRNGFTQAVAEAILAFFRGEAAAETVRKTDAVESTDRESEAADRG